MTRGVLTAPSVDTRTRVSGCVQCNAAFRGRLSRVNRITTVFSVLKVAISHMHSPPLYYMAPRSSVGAPPTGRRKCVKFV